MPALFAPGTEYIKRLRGLVRLVFGSSKLQVYLQSYESDRIAVGSISQFEVPPESGNYTDCAFVVRPTAKIGAPIMHGDARAAMSGSDEEFSMDFYNVNMAEIDVDTFFGDQIDKLTQGLALVAQYQRTGEDRGKYTRHLDPYKSDYRIEIEIPDTDVEAELQAYHDSALAAFKLFADAYLTALARLEPEDDADLISGTKAGTDVFINTLLEEDTAAKLGLLLFKEEAAFSHYFNEGFWRAGYYGPGL
jgi:hypothetical protein